MSNEKKPDNLVNTRAILDELYAERMRQAAKFGEQNWPDGTGAEIFARQADAAKVECEKGFKEGTLTWNHILTEEFFEALAEGAESDLRTELVQTAAVCVAWVEAIDRRRSKR